MVYRTNYECKIVEYRTREQKHIKNGPNVEKYMVHIYKVNFPFRKGLDNFLFVNLIARILHSMILRVFLSFSLFDFS